MMWVGPQDEGAWNNMVSICHKEVLSLPLKGTQRHLHEHLYPGKM